MFFRREVVTHDTPHCHTATTTRLEPPPGVCLYPTAANVCFAVLDEADRMVDMGFQDDVLKILDAIPAMKEFTAGGGSGAAAGLLAGLP